MNQGQQNNCQTFLNPPIHTYDTINENDDLNIGVLNASKKLFELGVEYTKDVFITITTAEATILVEASLKALEHFLNKLEQTPVILKVGNMFKSQMSNLGGLLESSENIIRYIGYDYLTKSYSNYASTNKLTQEDINGFKKLLDVVKPNIQLLTGGSNDKLIDVVTIVDKLTDNIMKLPLESQETELLKFTDMLKKRIRSKKQSGGRIKRIKRTRVIRNMIKRSMRKFGKRI